jgi:hypothetical protein
MADRAAGAAAWHHTASTWRPHATAETGGAGQLLFRKHEARLQQHLILDQIVRHTRISNSELLAIDADFATTGQGLGRVRHADREQEGTWVTLQCGTYVNRTAVTYVSRMNCYPRSRILPELLLECRRYQRSSASGIRT